MILSSNIVLNNNRELIEKSVIDPKFVPFFDGDYLGCGTYGCVFETHSKKVVLKLTTDLGEIKFVTTAMNLGEWPEGMVQYYQLMPLDKISIFNMFGLWREKASSVGQLSETSVSPLFTNALNICWNAAKRFRSRPLWDRNPELLNSIVSEYIKATERDVGKFNHVLHAMGWYAKHGILIGDVHLGNLGKVKRKEHDRPIWVITDPGEAVFVDNRYNSLFREYGL